MDADVKKMLVRWACELRYGCAYVYVRPPVDDVPYRFYFSIFGCPQMWRCVRHWVRKGYKVNIWRPSVSRSS